MIRRSASVFLDVLEARLSSPQSVCVVRIDLDRFARIGHTHGAEAADLVRGALETRITEFAGMTDGVVRLDEDSYTVILDPARCAPDDRQATALEVMRTLSEPIQVPGQPDIAVGCNVGLACSRTFVDTSAIGIITAADAAVQSANSLGYRRAVVYEPSQHQHATTHPGLYADMLPAVQHEEFTVHFQPIFSLPDRRLAGAEALARWAHPRHGLLLPRDFLPEAETSGLIRQIDSLVRRMALAQAAATFASKDLSITLNVSAADLDLPSLGRDVCAEVEASGLAPHQVTVEMTETALAAHWDTARSSLTTMKEAGIRLAMDDFGTGHMYLDRLSSGLFDLLKIDRSLVAAPPPGSRSDGQTEARRLTLLETIVDMAHSFGMPVVAEGVETEDEYARAVQTGCDYAQGFLLGRPAPPQELSDAVAAR